jgi:hypothetical protein
MRSNILAVILLAAAATVAHAGLVFNNDITGGINRYLIGQPDTPAGSVDGSLTDGGAGFMLWGWAGLSMTGNGPTGISLSWSGTTAPGSSLVQNVDLCRFGYHFTVDRTISGEPQMLPIFWSLMLTLTDLPADFSQSVIGSGIIAPHGGLVLAPFGVAHPWTLQTMSVTNWSAVLNVWVVDGAFEDDLSVDLPAQTTIDFLYAGGQTAPEPSGAALAISGLGAALLAARRRASRSAPPPRS